MSDQKKPVSREAVEKTAATLHAQSQKSGFPLSLEKCRERAGRVATLTNNRRNSKG